MVQLANSIIEIGANFGIISIFKHKMLFLLIFCLIVIEVKSTVVTEEDLAPFLQKWKDQIRSEILEEIEPMRTKLELCSTSNQQIKNEVEEMGIKINEIFSEMNQTKSENIQEELNTDSEISGLSNHVNHLKFMSKLIKVNNKRISYQHYKPLL